MNPKLHPHHLSQRRFTNIILFDCFRVNSVLWIIETDLELRQDAGHWNDVEKDMIKSLGLGSQPMHNLQLFTSKITYWTKMVMETPTEYQLKLTGILDNFGDEKLKKVLT